MISVKVMSMTCCDRTLLSRQNAIVGFISKFFEKFSQNLSLCSVLYSLEEELYWTPGWLKSPWSERSAA